MRLKYLLALSLCSLNIAYAEPEKNLTIADQGEKAIVTGSIRDGKNVQNEEGIVSFVRNCGLYDAKQVVNFVGNRVAKSALSCLKGVIGSATLLSGLYLTYSAPSIALPFAFAVSVIGYDNVGAKMNATYDALQQLALQKAGVAELNVFNISPSEDEQYANTFTPTKIQDVAEGVLITKMPEETNRRFNFIANSISKTVKSKISDMASAAKSAISSFGKFGFFR